MTSILTGIIFADFRGQGTSELEYGLQHKDVDSDPASKPVQRVDPGVTGWLGVRHKSASRITPMEMYEYTGWPTRTLMSYNECKSWVSPVDLTASHVRGGVSTLPSKE